MLPPFHRRGQEAQQEQQERQQRNVNIRNGNGKEIQDLLKHVEITSSKALEMQGRTSVSLSYLCSENQFLFNQSSLQSKRDGWSPAPISSSGSLYSDESFNGTIFVVYYFLSKITAIFVSMLVPL